MKTLVPATVLMIGLDCPGEVADSTSTKWIFWVLAMIPFVYILYTLNARSRPPPPRDAAVAAAIKNATMVLLITWLVYPIAYLFPVFDDASGTLETLRQIGTIADITSKALYGLMVLGNAKARSHS